MRDGFNPRIPGPLPRWFDRVRLPVSSPVTSAFPTVLLGRLNHNIPLNDFRAGSITRLQSFDNLQVSGFAATQVVPTAGVLSDVRAAVAFTSEQNAVRCLPAHRIMLAVRNRAIDGRGLSPPRSAALLAATKTVSPCLASFTLADLGGKTSATDHSSCVSTFSRAPRNSSHTNPHPTAVTAALKGECLTLPK
jgi:hypothetical protein